MMRYAIVICIMLIGPGIIHSDAITDESNFDFSLLTYMTEEFAPFNYDEDGELKGISVEIFYKIWDKLNLDYNEIQMLPWARAYYNLQNRSNQVLFTTSRTDKREHLFKWVGSIYTARLVLIGKSDSNIDIDNFSDLDQYSIGTVRDDVSEQLLITGGISLSDLHRVNTLEQNVSKLNLGRVDLISYAEESFLQYLKDNEFDRNYYRVVYVIEQTESYYAFSKDVPDSVILIFQRALDSLEQDRMEIVNRYIN